MFRRILEPLGLMQSGTPRFSKLRPQRSKDIELNSGRSEPFAGELKTAPENSYPEMLSLKNSGSFHKKVVFESVTSLLQQCAELGASEVFIGHPDQYSYECFVGDKAMQGEVDPAIYAALVRLFASADELEVEVDWPEVDRLQFSLTRNSSHPVIHVFWRKRWLEDSYLRDAPELMQ